MNMVSAAELAHEHFGQDPACPNSMLPLSGRRVIERAGLAQFQVRQDLVAQMDSVVLAFVRGRRPMPDAAGLSQAFR